MAGIAWLDRRDQWPGLQSIAMVEAARQEHQWDEEAGKRIWSTTTQRRYYMSSRPADAERIGAERIGTAVRAHWGIEMGHRKPDALGAGRELQRRCQSDP